MFHQRVAVLFQDFARFMLTAKENIGSSRLERIADVEATPIADPSAVAPRPPGGQGA